MLNLDDFSHLLAGEDKKNLSPEELERLYISRMEALEEKYRRLIDSVQKNAFEEGYNRGREDAEKEWQKKFAEEEKKKQLVLKREIETLKSEVKRFIGVLKDENLKFSRKILEIVADSLEEIFRFLLINEDNLPYLKEKIQDILEEFRGTSTVVCVEADERLADILKDIDGLTVRVNTTLQPGNFVVKFEDFSVVHDIDEKLSLLREEIEREIKKSSSL
ncbi:hypothetical protein [Desulfurobacterium sp.]